MHIFQPHVNGNRIENLSMWNKCHNQHFTFPVFQFFLFSLLKLMNILFLASRSVLSCFHWALHMQNWIHKTKFSSRSCSAVVCWCHSCTFVVFLLFLALTLVDGGTIIKSCMHLNIDFSKMNTCQTYFLSYSKVLYVVQFAHLLSFPSFTFSAMLYCYVWYDWKNKVNP